MPQQDSELARLRRTAEFIERKGYKSTGEGVRAILVAHAAERSNHWHAQGNAQKLLDAEGSTRQLKRYNPCIVLGVAAARRYFDDAHLRLLFPFHPACAEHDTRYDACSPDCLYGVKLDGRWVDELVTQTDGVAPTEADMPVAIEAPAATGNETTAGLSVGVSGTDEASRPPITAGDGERFLRSMESKARALEALVGSADHWAKPFYSSITTLVPGTTRAFIGLNGAGDRFAHQYDLEDRTHEWTWESPAYNAFLDDRWGDESRVFPVGAAPLQGAVRAVFKEMYGDGWESVLRSTACFNIMPISSRGQADPVVHRHWEAGMRWGIQLLEYLRPKLLVMNGNGDERSVWSAVNDEFGLREVAPRVVLENQTFSLKVGEIMSGTLTGCQVIGLPHLSRNRASPSLLRALGARRPYA